LSVYGGEILKVRRYKFYDLVTEMVPKKVGGSRMPIQYSLSKEGGYLGDSKIAYRLNKKYGIEQFEKTKDDHSVCSIGYSPRSKKWYGWSHRAIFGFKIGDKVKEGDCCNTSGYTDEYLKDHPEEHGTLPVGFEAKTEADCKSMAIAFAQSVS